MKATVPIVSMGGLEVSRLIIGGNPFSGFSHQSPERSEEMRAWYSDARIVETLFQAESLGLRNCLCRGDAHIARVLRRYWDEGGAMSWIAQTASEMGTPVEAARFCLDAGAAACYLHGGVMDHLIANERTGGIAAFVDLIARAGVPVGLAGHMPAGFLWAEANVDVDFYMVCYYDPSSRKDSPHHDATKAEQYLAADREERVALIQKLKRPVIHYKILAAGRLDAECAFAYAVRHMRPVDAVCVGIYTKDKPDMLAEDVGLFARYLALAGQ